MTRQLITADNPLEPEVLVLGTDAATDSVVRRLDGLGVSMRVLEDATAYRAGPGAAAPRVVLLGTQQAAAGAREVIAAAREGGLSTRIVRIAGVAAAPVNPGEGVTDVIVHPPVTTEALAAALGIVDGAAQLHAIDAAEIVRLSSFTGSVDAAMQHAVEVVRSAFGADAAFIMKGAALWVDGAAAPTNCARELLTARLSRSADESAVGIGSPLVWGDSPFGYESFEAAPMIGDGSERAGLIGLVMRGFRALEARQRQVLMSLGKRFGRELELREAQQRLVTELDAGREVGGLDPLTGAWSEASLLRLLNMLIAASRRAETPLSVAILDIRGLEQLNQRGGHAVGDAALRLLCEVTSSSVRAYDVVARYRGGVALVLPGEQTSDTVSVAYRVQRLLEDSPLDGVAGEPIRLQVRVGVAELDSVSKGAEALLTRARQAARLARRVPASLAAAPPRKTPDPNATPAVRSSTTGQALRSDTGATVSYSADLTGMTLGGSYRLLHRIASGGGGTVYRGEDLGLRRPVAVKLLSPELAHDEVALNRFRNEAATLAAISHPNLVQVYACGVDRGFSFFVMELVEGESVEGAVRRCALEKRVIPPSRIMRIVSDVASALDILHGFSVLHRDVKPANILLDPFRDRAVVVDVGVARKRESSDGYLAGTPAYMAPEVFMGTDIGPGVDVFGLAATVYEMVTLNEPWPMSENVREAIHVRSLLPPTPVSTHRPDLGALDEVMSRGLHADPSERYRSATVFARDFVAAMQEACGSSSPPSDQGVVSRRMRTSPPEQWEAERGSKHTRLVVFRSFATVVGVKKLARWRTELARGDARLAQALSPSAPPLAWFPTQTLVELLDRCPRGQSSTSELGRKLGRAAVRATFRRLFPASAATLSPQSTLTALPRIWAQYHGWGGLEISSEDDTHATITVTAPVMSEGLHGLVGGMLEQLLLLCGAKDVNLELLSCRERPGTCCRVALSWT